MDDITLYLTIASTITFLIFVVALLKERFSHREGDDEAGLRRQVRNLNREHDAAEVIQPPRRAAAVRNARARMRAQAHRQQASDEEDELAELGEQVTLPDSGKIGKKKLEKLKAKAEKRASREAAVQEREEQRERQLKQEEERRKQEGLEKEAEKKQEEEERLAHEERQRQEHELYLEMKKQFTVEETGFDEESEDANENLLQDFIKYIKSMKVVLLEDLAAHFQLKTQDAIDRIQQLQADGTLTGVIDDRGKFIYISQEELMAVAKFIKQRGRVSIAELAESSNKLISLTPDNMKAKKTLGVIN